MMHHRLCMLTMLLAGTAGAETICGTGPANIPDGTGGSCSWTLQIDTPAPELITSVRVLMTVDHPWVGDLSCTLFAPDGTSVRLIDRVGMPDSTWIGPWGCGGDDILCLFDDAGSTAAETACALDVTPVLSGNLQPLDAGAGLGLGAAASEEEACGHGEERDHLRSGALRTTDVRHETRLVFPISYLRIQSP